MGFGSSGGGGNLPDDVTIETNASGQLAVKDGGIGATQLAASALTYVQKKVKGANIGSIGSETEVDTVTFTPSSANDCIIVEGMFQQQNGGGASNLTAKVRISDGTNTHDITVFNNTNVAGKFRLMIKGQTWSTYDAIAISGHKVENTTLTGLHLNSSTIIEDFMQNAITISLRLADDGDDNSTYWWQVLEVQS